MDEQKKTNDLEGFTVTLALVDAVPVLFFCGSTIVLAKLFGSLLFVAGACLCILAGLGKVLWKLLLAIAHKNVRLLNRQLRILMPTGFLIMLLSCILDRERICADAIKEAVTSFPSALFFALGLIGMIAMSVFAKKLDGSDARSNWVEQITNVVAQGCFFVGLLIIVL